MDWKFFMLQDIRLSIENFQFVELGKLGFSEANDKTTDFLID